VNFVQNAGGANFIACTGNPLIAYWVSACNPGDSAAPTQIAIGKAFASITLAQKAGKNLNTAQNIIRNIALNSNPKINPAIYRPIILRIYPKKLVAFTFLDVKSYAFYI